MGYEIGMDEGHDCQVQLHILHTYKEVQLRYALVNPEHKHVFPLQGPMFVKPVSCKKTASFLELLDCAFAAARQAPMVAMNGRRMLDVMAGYLNRRMFGYVFVVGYNSRSYLKKSSSSFSVQVTTNTGSSPCAPICMLGWVLPALLPA